MRNLVLTRLGVRGDLSVYSRAPGQISRGSTHRPYGAGGGVTGGSWSGEGISGGIGSCAGWPGSTRPGAGGVVAGTSSGMGTGVRR